eukprot:441723_1
MEFHLYFKIIASVVIVFWNVSLFIATIWKLWNKNRNSKIIKPVLCFALMIFMSLSVGFIMNVLGVIYCKNWEDENGSNENISCIVLFSIYAICICIALVSAYLWTEALLYYSFKSSAFELSNRLVYCHMLNIVVILAIAIAAMVCHYLITKYASMSYIIFSICIVFLLAGLLHFVYLFNSKLFNLVLLMCHDEDNIHIKTKSSHRQVRLLQLITKFSVLTFFIIFEFIVMIIAGICESFISEDMQIVKSIFWCCYGIFVIFGTFFIFLSFQMNDNCYDILCSKCHLYFEKICQKRAEKHIYRMKNNDTIQVPLRW